MSERALTYHVEDGSPLAGYAIEFALAALGYRGAPGTRGSADIHYGRPPAPDSAAVAIAPDPAATIWPECLAGRAEPTGAVPFDLVGAIGRLLTDAPHQDCPDDAFDEHDRLRPGASLAARHGCVHVPVVNAYVRWLGVVLERAFGPAPEPPWPAGKRCAIGLSHDVDAPDKYAPVRGPWRLPHATPVGNLRFLAKKARMAVRRLVDPAPGSFWLFEPIMDMEQHQGFTSTFFFASVNQFGPWGSAHDVFYDIARPAFGPVFRDLAERGFEIGLHPSYRACESADRFVHEKQRLEQAAGAPVRGLRHHRWHLGRDAERTLAMHEQAGFAYDSSLAFNEAMGFRRSVAAAFRPWDANAQRALDLVELPVFCMDGSLFYQPIAIDDALARIQAFVHTIKTQGGVGVIDWHVRTSVPANREYRDWGEAYVRLLEWLAADDEVWVTNLGELNDWHRRRAERLSGA